MIPKSRLYLILSLLLLAFVVDGSPFNRKSRSTWDANRNSKIEDSSQTQTHSHATEKDNGDIPGVPYLVERIGKEIYKALNCPKYKFYIYMTIGTLPNETNTVAALSTICNILYGCFVFGGFLWLPRNQMLVWTLITLYIGPAMILALLGLTCLALFAFATYPIWSVCAIWLWFFCTSQIAQAIGKNFGLDQDGDGDVDLLDVLHIMANTKLGMRIGLPRLHNMLNNSTMDPFQEIHRRLDEIHNRIPDGKKQRLTIRPNNNSSSTSSLLEQDGGYNNNHNNENMATMQ